MSQSKPSAVEIAARAVFEAMPREHIIAAIAGISATLKGPGLTFKERLEMNDDRHALRKRLREIDVAGGAIMTAAPLSNSLAKVRKLLPVKISGRRYGAGAIKLVDRNGAPFCVVPLDDQDTAMARAELIRDAMNEME